MMDTRYEKLSGVHAGHTFVVVAPYGEIDTPMRWMLHMEGSAEDKLVVTENELADTTLWRPLS